MLFDTHAHMDDRAFDEDRQTLLASLPGQGIGLLMNPGCSLESSRRADALSRAYDYIYAAVGSHPDAADEVDPAALEEYRKLCRENPKIRAIGEIGLDYHFFYSDKETQKKWFGRQIELAKDLDLPFLIHDREAHGDTLSILKEHRSSRMRGIMHCFSGSLETAEEMMKLGFYISFAGPLVFPKSRRLKEAARDIPLDHLLIETDSPYLTPPPHRGERNEPANVIFVAREIARLKGLTVEKVVEETRKNGLRIYGIE